MNQWILIYAEIAALFFVILLGWVLRRQGLLSGSSTTTLSRLVVDVTLPALVFFKLLQTTDATSLSQSWFLPLAGAGVLGIGLVVGGLLRPAFASGSNGRTLMFVVGTPNWIYLPLPIAASLHGSAGVQAILLIHVGALAVLWTVGIALLKGQRPNLETFRSLALNPGLLATGAGLALALQWPAWSAAASGTPPSGWGWTLLAGPALKGLGLLGSLTIPLSLLVIGAQLRDLNNAPRPSSRSLLGTLGGRLVLTPVVVGALLAAAVELGLKLTPAQLTAIFLVATMPPAVNASLFTQRFGGDQSLAAQSVFQGTLLSLVTVPLWFWVLARF